jgi:hypothetical protein
MQETANGVRMEEECVERRIKMGNEMNRNGTRIRKERRKRNQKKGNEEKEHEKK